MLMASLKYHDHYLHQEQEDKYEQEEVKEELFGHDVSLKKNEKWR